MPTCLFWVMWWGFSMDLKTPYGGYPHWLNVFGSLWVYVGLAMVVFPAFFPYVGKASDAKTAQKANPVPTETERKD